MNKFKKFVIPFVLVLALIVGSVPAYAASPSVQTPAKATLGYTSITYNGYAKKPAVKVYDADGNIISSDNYTVTYSGNKMVGQAKVVITMKAPYTGTFTKYFKINARVTVLKSWKVSEVKKATKSIKAIKGASKVVKVKWSGNSSKLTVTKTGYVKVKKGTKKGTYKIKVRIYGAGNYNPVTKIITIKVK